MVLILNHFSSSLSVGGHASYYPWKYQTRNICDAGIYRQIHDRHQPVNIFLTLAQSLGTGN